MGPAPSGEDEFEADCAAMGMPEDETDEARDKENEADERFGVWPENERALGVFLICQRQWRVHPMGGLLGLDYAGIEALLRMRKIDIDAALLDDLALMEGAALEVMNEKGEK